MAIPFECPHCGKRTQVANQYAGQSGPCGECGQTVTVPALQGQPSSTSRRGDSKMSALVLVLLVGFGGLLLLVGAAVAVFLPATRAARSAARRVASMNNMKVILLGMHNYHHKHKSLPPAVIADATGKPMHSWRVLLLPYLDQQALQGRYDFSKPWNAGQNAFVRRSQVQYFISPDAPATPQAFTNYFLITGKGTPFEAGRAPTLQELNRFGRVLIVEAKGLNVEWTEPQDIDINDAVKLLKAGNLTDSSGKVRVGYSDGSVQTLNTGVAIAALERMVERAAQRRMAAEEDGP